MAHTLIHLHRQRTLVALALMAAQAFFYNAIFFTYALVLTTFYGIPSQQVGWYILPFAAGNVLGPLLLGRLFDTIGRRPMIAFTYLMSGLLLALTGWLFAQGMLSAREQTLAWSVIFFFASAAASSAYLTVSETFPLEIRALAIALFYAVGTGIGGRDRAAAVRRADRHRLAHEPVRRLPARRRPDDRRGRGHVALGRRGRAQAARAGRAAARVYGLIVTASPGAIVAARDHLRIDAAIRVIEGLHQGRGNREIADAGIRIDIGRRAAHDPLGHLQPRGADRDLLPDQAEFMPGRPARDIEIGAEAQRMHRHADHGLDRRHARRD